MATLHADDGTHSAAGGADESINHKCRVLNEKLDQLLGTLHEEASPVHGPTPRVSLDEDDDDQPPVSHPFCFPPPLLSSNQHAAYAFFVARNTVTSRVSKR